MTKPEDVLRRAFYRIEVEDIAKAALEELVRERDELRMIIDEATGADCDANGYAPCNMPERCLKCARYHSLSLTRERDEARAQALEEAAQVAEAYEPHCEACPRGVAGAIRHLAPLPPT